jgi:hypothetical protein
MIKRILLSFLGALVLFVWGFLGHVVLGIYDPAFNAFDNELQVAEVLEANAHIAGIYYLPAEPRRDGTPQTEAFVNFVPAGQRSGFGAMIGRGIILDAIAVFLLMTLLAGGRNANYLPQVGRFALAGFLLGFVVHAYYFNWFDFPAIYFAISVGDTLVGWTLVGLAVAGLMQPTRSPP